LEVETLFGLMLYTHMLENSAQDSTRVSIDCIL